MANIKIKEEDANGAQWRQSALELLDGEYHIIHNGILSRSDFSLLFEGEDGKKHLPVEATHQLNVYSDVHISSSALRLLSSHNIRIAFFNGIGQLQGYYLPAQSTMAGKCVLEQCRMYDHPIARLATAKEFEKADFHNMLSNLRYYVKTGKRSLKEPAQKLAVLREGINNCQSINELILLEARAKNLYYSTFDTIIEGSEFLFSQRSKRPPKNEVNAMISFGNAMLYNKFLQCICCTQLEPRIGVVHATNDRPTSLNLDFADIFKPLVVDRTIFSLINRHEIRREKHFSHKGGAVLLNEEGRRIFIEKMENKYSSQITIGEERMTYECLMSQEVSKFQDALVNGELYTPFKYR